MGISTPPSNNATKEAVSSSYTTVPILLLLLYVVWPYIPSVRDNPQTERSSSSEL